MQPVQQATEREPGWVGWPILIAASGKQNATVAQCTHGCVKEAASDQLQSVIKSFGKGFVYEGASSKLKSDSRTSFRLSTGLFKPVPSLHTSFSYLKD